jgi:hypothetical protein
MGSIVGGAYVLSGGWCHKLIVLDSYRQPPTRFFLSGRGEIHSGEAISWERNLKKNTYLRAYIYTGVKVIEHNICVAFMDNVCLISKIWGFCGGDYKKCLLGYKTPVNTSQETHYVSATEPSQLLLCKIWGFHGSHYEECRLLGYETPARTSPETRHVFVIESGLGFHCGDYEEFRLLGCDAV